MAKRSQAREEAAFMRGEVGIDGHATVEQQDLAEVEQAKAQEQFLRGKAFLGRELLTWLLWRSESGEAVTEYQGEPVIVRFAGRIGLRGVAGEVTELTARGASAPYAAIIRQAIDTGLLIHSARLALVIGEKELEATLDAEFLDVRSAKLPELLSEEDDDRVKERLVLCELLSGMVDALLHEFLKLRSSPKWRKQAVPQIKAWLAEAGEPKAAKKAKAS